MSDTRTVKVYRLIIAGHGIEVMSKDRPHKYEVEAVANMLNKWYGKPSGMAFGLKEVEVSVFKEKKEAVPVAAQDYEKGKVFAKPKKVKRSK